MLFTFSPAKIREDSSTHRLSSSSNSASAMFISQKKNPISRKTLDYLMKKYCSMAQIKDISKWHFHTLKHTRAVDLGNSGLDLKEIQYWLGHKEVSNTEIYFQFTSQQQENMYNKIVKNISRLS